MKALENLFTQAKKSIKTIGNYVSSAAQYLPTKKALRNTAIATLIPLYLATGCAFSGEKIKMTGTIEGTQEVEKKIKVSKMDEFIPDKRFPERRYALIKNNEGQMITYCRDDHRGFESDIETSETKITGWAFILSKAGRKEIKLDPKKVNKKIREKVKKIIYETKRGKIELPVYNIPGVGEVIVDVSRNDNDIASTSECHFQAIPFKGAKFIETPEGEFLIRGDYVLTFVNERKKGTNYYEVLELKD